MGNIGGSGPGREIITPALLSTSQVLVIYQCSENDSLCDDMRHEVSPPEPLHLCPKTRLPEHKGDGGDATCNKQVSNEFSYLLNTCSLVIIFANWKSFPIYVLSKCDITLMQSFVSAQLSIDPQSWFLSCFLIVNCPPPHLQLNVVSVTKRQLIFLRDPHSREGGGRVFVRRLNFDVWWWQITSFSPQSALCWSIPWPSPSSPQPALLSPIQLCHASSGHCSAFIKFNTCSSTKAS